MEESWTIDEFGPLPMAHPRSVAEVGDLVRRAASKNEAIYPVGGGTHLGIGLSPQKPGGVVGIRGLDQVIDYPARDMTITLQAGISISRLHEILAAEKQRLPVDIPLPTQATLGGAIAANVSGPRRYGWGTLRDYVIGISVVNDRGEEVKAGGRVVKNVAGYDLCKLYVGSLGTLGVITQVTLKLRPLPEESALVIMSSGSADIERLLNVLHESQTRPVCVELLNPAAVRVLNEAKHVALPEAWCVIVGFEDNRSAVAWQVQQLVRELPAASAGLDARIGDVAAPLWQALTDFVKFPCRVAFKANLLSSGTPAFCLQAEALLPDLRLQAHAGSGIIKGLLPPNAALEQVQPAVATLAELAQKSRGNLVLLTCPSLWKKNLSVWGRPRGDTWLMAEIKRRLDPQSIFNPGRFVGGI